MIMSIHTTINRNKCKHPNEPNLDKQSDKFSGQKSNKSINNVPKLLMIWAIWFKKIMISLSIMLLVYLYHYIKDNDTKLSTMAVSQDNLLGSPVGQVLECSKDYLDDRYNFKSCAPIKCGRFVSDSIVTDKESLQLRLLAETVFSIIQPRGGVAIFDITTGTLSNGTRFINLYKLIQQQSRSSNYKQIIKPQSIDVFRSVKKKLIQSISLNFGIASNQIFLTSPAFFTRIDPTPAQTLNDEYWHPHIDKMTYDGFVYTSLLYLATYNEEFFGGRFMFLDLHRNTTVEPKFGRVLFFTSGSENKHMVEKVASGARFAFTIPFTCDPNKEAKEPQI